MGHVAASILYQQGQGEAVAVDFDLVLGGVGKPTTNATLFEPVRK